MLQSTNNVQLLTYYVSNYTLLVERSVTSTETVGVLGTGSQDGHPDFHTAPEL